MGRDIKFRIWDNKCMEWIHDSRTPVNLFGEVNLIDTIIRRKDETIVSLDDLKFLDVDQYIGLEDCKGKGIFEGDIVKDSRNLVIGKVIYDPAIYRLADYNGKFTTSGYCDWDFVEIIGNIHQNPELLEVQP